MDLERLIAAEERNETLIAEARAEGEALVAAATAAAARREAALRDDVARDVAAAHAALDAEQARRITELQDAAHRAVERYDGVSDARIAVVVPALLARLLAEGVT